MGDSSRADETRYELARNRARGLLTLIHRRPPVDVQAIIDLAGIPVVERALPDGTRATIGDIAGRRSMILNRRWRFSSENERRWVHAEELGHVLIGHKLVESTEHHFRVRGRKWTLFCKAGGQGLSREERARAEARLLLPRE